MATAPQVLKVAKKPSTLDTLAYAAQSPTTPLAPFSFERRAPGPHDVQIEILYCGVCHSDLHQVRDEWQSTTYPIVPGHEIVGRVIRAGEHVTSFKEGDLAAVGCMVDSCRTCDSCREGLEQYCEKEICLVGVPEQPHPPAQPVNLIVKRRSIAGSVIGGIKETQEMLDFCAQHGIVSDIELIPIQQINQAYERMLRSDVRYRFVIDIGSLKTGAQA